MGLAVATDPGGRFLRLTGRLERWKLTARLHQPVEQGGVAIAAEHHHQMSVGLVPLRHQLAEQGGGRAGISTVQRVDLALQTFEQDVGIPRPTEGFSDPAQLGAGLLSPSDGQELPESAEVRPQPTGGHPGLVHVLRVLVQAHPEVVGEQSQIPLGDGRPDHLGHR